MPTELLVERVAVYHSVRLPIRPLRSQDCSETLIPGIVFYPFLSAKLDDIQVKLNISYTNKTGYLPWPTMFIDE